MASDNSSAMTKLIDIIECCICLKTFTDPRMLPCIHTFCFQCLQDMADKSNKKPGDEIQCPVCRKEFTLSNDGVQGIQKNFFMAGMIEVRNALNQSKMVAPPCDICRENNDATGAEAPEATVRCFTCHESLCEGCCKLHKTFKIMKNHEILNIGRDIKEEEEDEIVRSLQTMSCDIHPGKDLPDYYCAECKKVVCVLCLVESHRTHDCKDVTTVEEEFRELIKYNALRISTLAKELFMKKEKSKSKEDFLKKMAEREQEILQRSEELREMIDTHAKSLLSSLDEIKNRHLKEIQTKEDELERRLTILESFSRYCDELRRKGSASDICRSKDELLRRADELDEDHETFIMQPRVLFDVTFQATDLDDLLKKTNGNIIGIVNEKLLHLEDFVIAIGGTDISWNLHICKLNLHGHSEVASPTEDLPTTMKFYPAAAVYDNTMFITGVGEAMNEIWKYSFASGWKKCGSLVQGREDHCTEFISDTLYICGGCFDENVMDSIEAYNATTEDTTVVGQLRFGCKLAACVVYKGSIYVFGGLGLGLNEDFKSLDCVQVFNPVEGACTLLSTPLPRPNAYMQAVLWETYVVLVGFETCFIFDFEATTWQENRQFRADSNFFGLVLQNERVFLIDETQLKGDASYDGPTLCRPNTEDDVKYIRASSIVNNEAANWKSYGQMPKPLSVIATAKLSLAKQLSKGEPFEISG